MQVEENHLEQTLRLAAGEPAHRPDFYKALLDSTVYILSQSDNPSSSSRTIEAGEKISIQNWVRNDGAPVIPFFSSLTALQRAIDAENNYMALPARSLFEITKGAALVLNPKSDYGKEFFPDEIEALVSNGVNRLPEQRVTTKATQVFLGQPKDYPSRMVDALTTFLATRNNVKAAYLVLMQDPSHDEKPHLVIGIEADGDIAQVIREVGAVAGDTSHAGEPVDLIRVIPGEKGLSEYFLNEIKPFYERRWGGKLKAFFGLGHA